MPDENGVGPSRKFLENTKIGPAPKPGFLDYIKDPTLGVRKKIREFTEDWHDAGPLGWLPSDLLSVFSESFNPSEGSGQVAGLPYMAIKGRQPIYHGAREAFEKFDPSRYDTSDLLGSFTHFAENPHYANRYATGEMKASYGGLEPNIIAAIPESQNVLDLTQAISPTDIEAVMASVRDKGQRRGIAALYREIMDVNPNFDWNKDWLPDALKTRITNYFTKDPEQFLKTPFDAIRYDDALGADMTRRSWAIPPGVNIRTPWGTHVAEEFRPLHVERVK